MYYICTDVHCAIINMCLSFMYLLLLLLGENNYLKVHNIPNTYIRMTFFVLCCSYVVKSKIICIILICMYIVLYNVECTMDISVKKLCISN